MTEVQTISWIFLAIALATDTEPASIDNISSIADGINHAEPTQKELQIAIAYLIKQGLIVRQGKNYTLTSKGQQEYKSASTYTHNLLEIWKNLEKQLSNNECD